MRFNLIGPFQIATDGGGTIAPKAPKICQMLAVLALRPRETTATGTLVRELWGEDAPAGATRTLQTHVYHARRMLADAQVVGPTRQLLVTQAPGYQLDITDDEVDVRIYERHVQHAQWELDHGSPAGAAEHLARARKLWRGSLLSNLPAAAVLTGRMAHMEEVRIRALELHVETENRLGRHRELLPYLRTLVNDHPLHEWFHGQLISALHRASRRAEALQAYQNLYNILKTELGLAPSEEIQRLQAAILTAGPAADPRPLSRRPDTPVTPLWASRAAS
ncbi:BTAD domain-containing putative transcriptional regulator [Streptomyces cyaneofuscatus]|uniref:AfsR/SARP family transcriptional regulator n=1 Tax=Streptomyces cyaneofuscatus TaxID=66883 RepID=UPI0036BEDB3A